MEQEELHRYDRLFVQMLADSFRDIEERFCEWQILDDAKEPKTYDDEEFYGELEAARKAVVKEIDVLVAFMRFLGMMTYEPASMPAYEPARRLIEHCFECDRWYRGWKYFDEGEPNLEELIARDAMRRRWRKPPQVQPGCAS